MVTAARFRALALSQPEAEEKSHFGQADFRVRNKIFAGLSRDGTRGNLKLTFRIQAQLRGRDPKTFVPCAGAWGRRGWTYVELAHADYSELEPLMHAAWRLTAPKTLVASDAGELAAARTRSKRRRAT
jgi:hypothetical protein